MRITLVYQHFESMAYMQDVFLKPKTTADMVTNNSVPVHPHTIEQNRKNVQLQKYFWSTFFLILVWVHHTCHYIFVTSYDSFFLQTRL